MSRKGCREPVLEPLEASKGGAGGKKRDLRRQGKDMLSQHVQLSQWHWHNCGAVCKALHQVAEEKLQRQLNSIHLSAYSLSAKGPVSLRASYGIHHRSWLFTTSEENVRHTSLEVAIWVWQACKEL